MKEVDGSMSRRRFLQSSAIAGVAITVDPWPLGMAFGAEASHSFASPVQPAGHHTSWALAPGRARARIEGLAKVTGQKIYARDFRAKDLPGWPQSAQSVMILRASRVDRIFEAVDFSSLPKNLRPTKVITAKDIGAAHIQLPWFYPEPLLAIHGQAPKYLGQAVALLFFDEHHRYREALPLLLQSDAAVRYGANCPLPAPGIYGDTRFVRYEDDGKEVYSTLKDGPISAPWQTANPAGSANARGMHYAGRLASELAHGDWTVFAQSYETPSCDPMFMEGEAGLGYFDAKRRRLQLVLGTQSPHDDGEFAAVLASHPQCPAKFDEVIIHPCYPGGGFGGRDHSLFSMYVALAALFSDGRPVRLVQSRVEQFQSGIKRHAARIQETLAVDDAGKFQALSCDMVLNGGGQNNFSFAVAAVGAHNATGAYYFPRAHIHSVAQSTTAVTAGSMRGFGTLQSMFALECLIDEAAAKLEIDPLELRLRNLLANDLPMITGAKPVGALRTREIVEQMRSHPLWQRRRERRGPTAHRLYGVGAALALKTYGTAIGDAVLALITMDAQGRISLASNGIDMGNGSATSFAVAVARHLGANASELKMGATTDFALLKMVGSLPKDQGELDRSAKNPRWSPIVAMASAASTSAFNQVHAVTEAAKVIFLHGLWPAAQVLWGGAAKGLQPSQATWQGEALTAPGLRALPLRDLARRAHDSGLVTGACVHAYFMGQWATATFQLGASRDRLPVDGLAIRRGSQVNFQLLTREQVEFPPIANNQRRGVQTYTPCGALAAVEVDSTTGDVKVIEVQEFLDAGAIIVPENVEGQSHGGIAMAIGHTLYETLPAYDGGPGQGGYNLDRYQIARSADVPMNHLGLHLLAPLRRDEPAKGIAEIVMIPVVPAIVNAIAAATGKRFRSLPVTAEAIKGALHAEN